MYQPSKIWGLLASVVLAVLLITPAAAAKSTKRQEPAVASASACCPDRCVTYRYHRLGRHRCCEPCCQDTRVALEVATPDCCTMTIEVCLPGCCTDVPCVTTRCGMFGRNIVEYSWSCGARVRVVFDRCGDATVHCYGT